VCDFFFGETFVSNFIILVRLKTFFLFFLLVREDKKITIKKSIQEKKKKVGATLFFLVLQ
jgi:hypothetical protein